MSFKFQQLPSVGGEDNAFANGSFNIAFTLAVFLESYFLGNISEALPAQIEPERFYVRAESSASLAFSHCDSYLSFFWFAMF